MERGSIEERVRAIVKDATELAKVEFVHLEFAGAKRNQVIRVFIDRPGGVTIENCSDVSRRIEDVMDTEDFIPWQYILEVSSPGLDRELYKIADFDRFSGKLAKVKMVAGFDGAKNYNGRIIKVDSDQIVFEDRTEGEVRLPYSSIAKANLKVDIEEELKRR